MPQTPDVLRDALEREMECASNQFEVDSMVHQITYNVPYGQDCLRLLNEAEINGDPKEIERLQRLYDREVMYRKEWLAIQDKIKADYDKRIRIASYLLAQLHRVHRLRFVLIARMKRIQERKPLRVEPWFWKEADAAAGLQLLSLGRKLALLEAAA